MKWVGFLSDGRSRAGVVLDDVVHVLPDDRTLSDLLGDDGTALRAAAELALAGPRATVPLAELTLLAPISRPPSIRDFMAFEEHVVTSMAALGEQVHPDWYELPVFYFTNPAAVTAPGADVPIAPGSAAFDYELEVAAIIGRGGRDLDPATAEAHIAGYTILCDWSARDLQEREMRLNLGPSKGKDTATSLGPWLVTPDELASARFGRAFDLPMTASVNGRPYSSGNLKDIYWSFGEMIAYASRGVELRPGDVIGSGTVGTGCILELSRVHGKDAYPYLRDGDEVTLAVEGLGELTHRVRAAVPPVPFSQRDAARKV